MTNTNRNVCMDLGGRERVATLAFCTLQAFQYELLTVYHVLWQNYDVSVWDDILWKRDFLDRRLHECLSCFHVGEYIEMAKFKLI